MAIVGVAGGTGSIGRAVVEAIKATGKHQVKILGRKVSLYVLESNLHERHIDLRQSNPTIEADVGVPIVVVDYTNVDSLKDALESNQIDVVISTLNTASTDGDPPEIVLIRAANASACTKRFVPSNWSTRFTEEHAKLIPLVPAKLQAVSELKESNLEYTVFYNGVFLDYLGFNGIKSYLPPTTLILDLPHDIAAIPGDGNTPVVFTHTTDIAKYVAASLDLPTWDPESYVVGEKTTWSEVVRIAQELKGTKFQIKYDSLDKLDQGQITELPGHIPAYAFVPKDTLQFLLAGLERLLADGSFNLNPKSFLNDKLPEIKPLKVKDVLAAAVKAL
ncbi:hypothetical protein NW754_004640 [Fusarium falciforme]|nr:hypothetical protein NW754_004640 [Fusarium falciforme]KAJ4257931.1 hypothetical protein NW757_003559 [Fusarium falciforme]